MKKFLFVMLFLLMPTITMAGSFSDLNSKCMWETEGVHSTNNDKLILKHINQRITKTEGYVKVDDYLFMVANTFTDNYRFLGSYFLKYDCREKKTTRISSLLKGNNPSELGFLTFDPDSNNMKVALIGNNANTVWVYDYSEGKLKKVDYRKVSKPKNKLTTLNVNLASYDGYSIDIEQLYYTKVSSGNGYSYQYENYGNPTIVKYNF
ncbi:hypothetical protein K2X92_03570 [Candidatus Gracilibacteria bacterium]|nr:hypothetical protein [Candidatus Gracilibacteria bacterium]